MAASGTNATDSEALGRLLRRQLKATGQGEAATVSVAELHRSLLPYPSCREELGLATKAEYDLAILHLLEDPAVVRIAEDALAEAVREELESPEPGLAFLRNFAASPLEIGPLESRAPEIRPPEVEPGEEDEADDRLEAEPQARDVQPEGSGEDPGREAAGEPAEEVPEAVGEEAHREPRGEAHLQGEAEHLEVEGERGGAEEWLAALDEPEDAKLDVHCRSCDRELPRREGVRYCPHCGADQQVARCRSCGDSLEPDWNFCPRCGGAAEGG